MCKIVALTDTKKLNLKRHINNIGNTLLETEPDGFGYAVQGKLGQFGEKTIAPKFRTRLDRKNRVTLPIVKPRFEFFGQSSELAGPGIFHGRVSTNVVSLLDTHPMQSRGWNLIHNGVVDDHGPKYHRQTNNDSEDVLHRLIEGIKSVEDSLEGYYAFAAIDPEGQLHVCRDQYATLFIAYSPVYESHILATTEELLLKVNKILEAKIGPIEEIADNVYMIFKGNELVHHQSITTLGYTNWQAQKAQASLGRTLSQNATTPALARSETDWNDVMRRHTSSAQHHARQIIDVAPTDEDKDWVAASDTFMKSNMDAHHRRDERDGDDEETNYYSYLRELDNLDASYQIYDIDDKPMDILEFRKLDMISKEMCTVIRGDGTIVSADDYDNPRLSYREVM